MKLSHIVDNKDNKKRVVDILCGTLGMSRLLTKRIRLYGILTVNEIHHRMIDTVSEGDRIFLSYKEPLVPHEIQVADRDNIKVLFCDEYLVVVSKPSGIVTHPTTGHQTGTLTDLFSELKLHPVSRLDRETSGVIIFARDPHSHYKLSKQHQDKTMEKEYLGIVHGIFDPLSGTIDEPIKRAPDSIMLRCIDPSGDIAVTHYQTIRTFPDYDTSIVKFHLETGRTHQIRVHSLHRGHPLIGDGLYGASSKENGHYQKSAFLDDILGRQALHAASVTISHPMTGERMTFTADMPEDMVKLINLMGT
ncbi:MAG: RluA family pseudouridine synthase [Saccharofermentanales bacterium]